MQRLGECNQRVEWSNFVDVSTWMRKAMLRAKVRRVFEDRDPMNEPTYELLDHVSNMVFRAQICEKRVVVTTCFVLDNHYLNVA
jgi:hypothetical protein